MHANFGLNTRFTSHMGRFLLGSYLACMVATIASASTADDRLLHSEVIQAWDFGRKDDPNKQGRPRDFKQRTGPEYPAYQQIKIVSKHPENEAAIETIRRNMARLWFAWKQKRYPWKVFPESIPPWIDLLLERDLVDPCLEMRVNGGAFEVQCPIFEMEQSFSYVCDLQMETIELQGFDAFAEILLLDGARKPIRVIQSVKLSNTTPWTSIQVGPIDIKDARVAYGQLKLHVLPQADRGFRGVARVDRIRILKMPQLSLELNQDTHLYQAGSPVEIRCHASGMMGEFPTIKLLLTDHHGQVYLKQDLTIEPIENTPPKAKPSSSSQRTQLVQKKTGWHGTAIWKLPTLEPGFYTVQCELAQQFRYQLPRRTRFCIFNQELVGNGDTRFGWSLPNYQQYIARRKAFLVSCNNAPFVMSNFPSGQKAPIPKVRMNWLGSSIASRRPILISWG